MFLFGIFICNSDKTIFRFYKHLNYHKTAIRANFLKPADKHRKKEKTNNIPYTLWLYHKLNKTI